VASAPSFSGSPSAHPKVRSALLRVATPAITSIRFCWAAARPVVSYDIPLPAAAWMRATRLSTIDIVTREHRRIPQRNIWRHRGFLIFLDLRLANRRLPFDPFSESEEDAVADTNEVFRMKFAPFLPLGSTSIWCFPRPCCPALSTAGASIPGYREHWPVRRWPCLQVTRASLVSRMTSPKAPAGVHRILLR